MTAVIVSLVFLRSSSRVRFSASLRTSACVTWPTPMGVRESPGAAAFRDMTFRVGDEAVAGRIDDLVDRLLGSGDAGRMVGVGGRVRQQFQPVGMV